VEPLEGLHLGLGRRVVVRLAGVGSRDPAGDVGVGVGAGRRQVAHRAALYERLAHGLARPDRKLRGGEDRIRERLLEDAHRGHVVGRAGDGIGEGPSIRSDRVHEVRPGDHRRGGGDRERRARGAAPPHQRAVGQHHAVAQSRQLHRLTAAV
jgi:hypothetical protein